MLNKIAVLLGTSVLIVLAGCSSAVSSNPDPVAKAPEDVVGMQFVATFTESLSECTAPVGYFVTLQVLNSGTVIFIRGDDGQTGTALSWTYEITEGRPDEAVITMRWSDTRYSVYTFTFNSATEGTFEAIGVDDNVDCSVRAKGTFVYGKVVADDSPVSLEELGPYDLFQR